MDDNLRRALDRLQESNRSLSQRVYDLTRANSDLRMELRKTNREIYDCKGGLMFIAAIGLGFILRVEYGEETVRAWSTLALIVTAICGVIYLAYRLLKRLFRKTSTNPPDPLE